MEYAYFKRVTLVSFYRYGVAWHLQSLGHVILLCALYIPWDDCKRMKIEPTRFEEWNDEYFIVSIAQANGVPFRNYRYQAFSAAKMIYRWPNFKLCINWCWNVAVFWCFFLLLLLPLGIFLIPPPPPNYHRNFHLLFLLFFMFYLFTLHFIYSSSCFILWNRTQHFFFLSYSSREIENLFCQCK